ncbi:hypothetical protein [Sphingomonas koreensis]|uniref:hypothetical protein n=1 Tax=Sphingomonas koreensis TaxID=93064 RepID=UPI000F7DEBC7|nr:hypothetical protein [Sphingomonas koreensis]MDC7808813.1 hypothetical protein [Sphingomonas koreensis]RSU98952.1 hypothetical protein CA256_03210 [Sphingomonas koreensis]
MKPAVPRLHGMDCRCAVCWRRALRAPPAVTVIFGLALLAAGLAIDVATRGPRSSRFLAGGLLGLLVVIAIGAAGGPSPLVIIGK